MEEKIFSVEPSVLETKMEYFFEVSFFAPASSQ